MTAVVGRSTGARTRNRLAGDATPSGNSVPLSEYGSALIRRRAKLFSVFDLRGPLRQRVAESTVAKFPRRVVSVRLELIAANYVITSNRHQPANTIKVCSLLDQNADYKRDFGLSISR